jgi:Homeodomain-like domain
MPGPKPAVCTFPEDFLQQARSTVRQRTATMQAVQRYRLVLLLHDRPDIASEQASTITGLSARQIQRWRSRWAGGDYSIEDLPGRGRKASFSPPGSSLGYRHRL